MQAGCSVGGLTVGQPVGPPSRCAVGGCMHLGPPIHPPREPGPAEVLYRLYFFNGGNHITTSNEFFASTDTEAMEAAEQQLKGQKAELWQRTRLVKVWR